MLTPQDLYQIVFAFFSWGAAWLFLRVLWKKGMVKKVKDKRGSLNKLIKPLAIYSLFLTIFACGSLIFYTMTSQIVMFNLIFQWSFIFLVAHYSWHFSRSKLVYAGTLCVSYALWYANQKNILKPGIDYINQYSLKLGGVQITPVGFIKVIATLAFFVWVTGFISDQVKTYIRKIKHIRANTKEILYKFFDISLYFIAILLVLNILGINLSTLTVIGGALSVGIGFGLQKITSNFISGLILLFEKTIEVDDLIEMDNGVYGFVKRLGSRYTIVETFDGKEILIPNEDFMTNRVTNWTFSNKMGRVEIRVGVSYKSDIKKAQALMLEAASQYPLCLKEPPPKCFLQNFGDSSVDFVLFFYIGDVTVGRLEPQSDVMMAIWEKFKHHDIEIPFPQRDIHIKTEG